ncbi:cupin domain-containing protein [Agrococcus sp. HG114]|uniref:cupin domain-containing protein n=1 Tax=Agrococcus sp. HG114 TaxID=2969757 RepID=UPI00215AA826|nr:cupin domain-containing protein [Agrococcus sp. HG114]MCR8669556.1 cupin domain-containing protein [Agrococcus sp. HG114]
MNDKIDTPHTLRTKDQHIIEPQPWGRLEWYVSAAIGNSEKLTVGLCVLDPGQANGRHWHPTSDEVLTVRKGSIIHTWNDQEFPMEEGDVISIPQGVVHNARNVGEGQAELSIVFSTAYRTTEGEES